MNELTNELLNEIVSISEKILKNKIVKTKQEAIDLAIKIQQNGIIKKSFDPCIKHQPNFLEAISVTSVKNTNALYEIINEVTIILNDLKTVIENKP